jgi:hypothetical protein
MSSRTVDPRSLGTSVASVPNQLVRVLAFHGPGKQASPATRIETLVRRPRPGWVDHSGVLFARRTEEPGGLSDQLALRDRPRKAMPAGGSDAMPPLSEAAFRSWVDRRLLKRKLPPAGTACTAPAPIPLG